MKHKKTKTSSTHKITVTVAITMKDSAPVFLKAGYIQLTNFIDSVMNKEKKEYRNISSQEMPPDNRYLWLQEALVFLIVTF